MMVPWLEQQWWQLLVLADGAGCADHLPLAASALGTAVLLHNSWAGCRTYAAIVRAPCMLQGRAFNALCHAALVTFCFMPQRCGSDALAVCTFCNEQDVMVVQGKVDL